jgi:hypothetical protein
LEARGRQITLDEADPEDRGRLARLLRIAEKVKIDLAGARSDSTMVDFRARDILVDIEQVVRTLFLMKSLPTQ